MAHHVNEGLTAHVRLAEGGTVKLHEGDTVPSEADETHVAALVERGVLSEKPEPKAPAGGKQPKD